MNLFSMISKSLSILSKVMRVMGFTYEPGTAGSSVRFDPPHPGDPVSTHSNYVCQFSIELTFDFSP